MHFNHIVSRKIVSEFFFRPSGRLPTLLFNIFYSKKRIQLPPAKWARFECVRLSFERHNELTKHELSSSFFAIITISFSSMLVLIQSSVSVFYHKICIRLLLYGAVYNVGFTRIDDSISMDFSFAPISIEILNRGFYGAAIQLYKSTFVVLHSFGRSACAITCGMSVVCYHTDIW